MNFGMFMWNQTMERKYNYSFLVYTKTEDIYVNLGKDTILQIMNKKHHYLKEKIKKVIGLMRDELGKKIIRELPGLRPKTLGYLRDEKN